MVTGFVRKRGLKNVPFDSKNQKIRNSPANLETKPGQTRLPTDGIQIKNPRQGTKTYIPRPVLGMNATNRSKNSAYQNSSFQRKKETENGFMDSGLRMNQQLAKYEKWGLEELEDRNEKMLQKALSIWPMPETAYVLPVVIRERVSLDDDISLRNKRISSYEYFGASKSVSNWADMYREIVGLIYEENPMVLKEAFKAQNEKILTYFCDTQKQAKYEKLRENLFINLSMNTDNKIKGLQMLFELYEIDQNELVFVLKN